MAITNEAKIKVTIDGKEAEVSISQLGKAIKDSMKKSDDAVKGFKQKLTDIKTLASAAMAGFVVKDFIAASDQQEKSVAAMEQALKSMGRYTEEFSSQLQNAASEIQNNGIIGDEVLLEGTKFLATYKGIGDDVMPRAMKVMADFAALTGGDVTSAANILGKASMGMTGEMARYGITLSDTAKKSKDFNLILQEIEEQVGGQNKALSQTRAGSMQQFANAVGDLKEKGGDLIKVFIIPFQRMLTPLVDLVNSMDHATLMMIGTLGIAAATVFKVVIPALRAFGVASKSAMGWIGAIIAIVELLYVAWDSNFLGIRDAIDVVWSYMKGFWEFIKDFGGRVGKFYSALGEIILGALSFNKDKIVSGWNKLKDSLVSGWGETMEKVKSTTKKGLSEAAESKEIRAKMTQTGEDAGAGFVGGVKRQLKNFGFVGAIKGGNNGAPDRLEEAASIEPIAATVNDPLVNFMLTLEQTKLTASNAFEIIGNGVQQLGNRMNNILWGSRESLKDVWKSIAMDFSSLFIQAVLQQITKVMVVQMLKLLAMFDVAENDRMAAKVGGDYARHFTDGVMKGLSKANLAGAMAGTGRQGGGVTVNVGADRVYASVNAARNRERIRQGNDINKQNFS